MDYRSLPLSAIFNSASINLECYSNRDNVKHGQGGINWALQLQAGLSDLETKTRAILVYLL